MGERPGPFPTKLQYSSSWLLEQPGDGTQHFPWLPPPLLVRRYDVVFSELGKTNSSDEITKLGGTDYLKIVLAVRPT